MKYVEEVLKKYNINDRELLVKEMINYDIDSDKEKEKIFTVSNLFETEYAPSKIFSFIFVVKNDEIIMVSKMIDTLDKRNSNCNSYVHSLVDLNDDGQYEIITGCRYYNNNKNCIEMYEYKNKKYQRIKSCSN